MLKELGVILLIMIVLVIIGNIWFDIVDGILEKIKNLITGNNNKTVWHEFPGNKDKNNHY